MADIISIDNNKKINNLEVNTGYFNNKYISTNNIFYKDMVENIFNNNLNDLSFYEKNKFDNLKYKIINFTNNEEFIEKIMFRLDILKKYGSYKWLDNGIIGSVTGNRKYKLCIKHFDNKLYYKNTCGNVSSVGTLKMINDKYFISYEEYLKNKLLQLDKEKSDYISKKYSSTSHLYDKDDYELYSKVITKNDNYYYNGENGEIVLVPTDTLENSVEIKKYLRRNNYILHQYKLTFMNKDHAINDGYFNYKVINKDELYVGENYMYGDKYLPKMTFFQRVDESLFTKLLKKR